MSSDSQRNGSSTFSVLVGQQPTLCGKTAVYSANQEIHKFSTWVKCRLFFVLKQYKYNALMG